MHNPGAGGGQLVDPITVLLEKPNGLHDVGGIETCNMIVWNNFIHEISEIDEAHPIQPPSLKSLIDRLDAFNAVHAMFNRTSPGSSIVYYAANYPREFRTSPAIDRPLGELWLLNVDATNELERQGRSAVRSDLFTLSLAPGDPRLTGKDFYDGLHYPDEINKQIVEQGWNTRQRAEEDAVRCAERRIK